MENELEEARVQDGVERILEGNFNNDMHSLDFSSPIIELKLKEGEDYEGSFTIYGPENELTEGTVSSSRIKMKCLVPAFSGQKEEIGYHFDTSGMAQGDTLKGEFRIVSNQGEYMIPYTVTIEAGTLQSGLGDVKNLFHFTDLARTNWEEAVNLFYSRDFYKVFNGADRQHYSCYRGLLLGERREQNVEEFLLQIKKKQKVELLLEEEEIRLDNPQGVVESRLVINRNGWGYSELSVEAEGDFITLEKETIREEDFLGNCYRLPFYVSEQKLHAGRNYGTIKLSNPYTVLTARIVAVSKPVTTRITGIRRQKNHGLLELMQYYEAFRTKKISASSWMKETDTLLQRLCELDDRDVSLKLFRVQLLITQERFNEAKWLLDQQREAIEVEFAPANYSYYLYLTSLIEKRDSYIDEVAQQVERIFAQNPGNWRIAWLLLYLSEDYSKSPSKKWIMLGEQFRQGCSSPVLYIESWNLLLSSPTLLMHLDGFELQVLTYAAKNELLVPGVIEQITYLAGKQKEYSGRLLEIMKACYQVVPSREILQTICTLLIKGGRTDGEAFNWYAKGIEKELRITRLYEYYMMSIDLEKDQEIPRMVLMYFAFDSTLDGLHNSYLYAYLYKNKAQYPELFATYREQIERFMVFQLLKGKNNPYLATLYKNLITPVMVTPETAKGLSTALFLYKLSAKRRDIRKVIVVYEKERYELTYPMSGTETYLPLYGEDGRIILEDRQGNRFCREEEYHLERLMLPDKLADMIVPYVEDCVHFDLWFCARGRELSAVSEQNEAVMNRLTHAPAVIEEVQKEIRRRLIHYYYDHDRMKDLDSYLEELTPSQIEDNCFTEVVRIMVMRGMYEKAYDWIGQRGGEGIEAKLIVRLCSRLLSLEGMSEDETMTTLSYMAFRAGKYDENILQYLCLYFKGTCKEMRDIWKAAEGFGVDVYSLGERILVQLLYSGAHVGEKTTIFRKYVEAGAKGQIEIAFLSQSAYDYFVREKLTDGYILKDMQRLIRQGEELPFVCKLAYTKYYAENKKLINEEISRWLILFLREILDKKLYFPYFREYTDHIAFMRRFEDKTMIEYHAKEGSHVEIHYLVEREDQSDGEYQKEEMQDMFHGIFVKQFILFFGERLQYYITEKDGEKEQLTESGTLSRNETDAVQKEGRFNLLNDISTGRTLHDYSTMERLLEEYFLQEQMVKEIFQLH